MFEIALFTAILAFALWHAASYMMKKRTAKKVSGPQWKISSHVGVLSTKSNTRKDQSIQNHNSANANSINSNSTDRYATPWNNVPLGMKHEDIYEPNTGELFRRLDSDFKKVQKGQLTSQAMSSTKGREASSTPASIRKINPYMESTIARYRTYF